MIRDVSERLIEQLDEDLRALLLLRMPGEAGRLARQVAADWREVCAALDYERPRPTRPCPYCSRLGMWNATRCGYCWSALTPLAEPPSQGVLARSGDGQALAALDSFEGEGGALGESGRELRSH